MTWTPTVVGQTLINALAASSGLGHKRLASTLRDYCDWDNAAASPEARFVQDAIIGPVPDAVTRWFGNADSAREHALDVALG